MLRAKPFQLVFHLALWLLLVTGCIQKRDTSNASTMVFSSQESSACSQLPGAWEPEVRNNLLRLIKIYGRHGSSHDPSEPPVVIFDFDNTCIRGDIGRSFYDWMVIERKILFSEQVFQAFPADKVEGVRKAWKRLSMLPTSEQANSSAMRVFRKTMHEIYWSLCSDPRFDKCFPWQVRFYAGYRPEELANMADRVMEMELKRPLGSQRLSFADSDPNPTITGTGIRIFKEIRTLIALFKQSGFNVWIVSAGPQWIVEGAASHLGISSVHVIGMRTRLENGRLTTETEPPPTFREGKVRAIKKYIGIRPILAVGDSWTDAEMLAYSRHALLIDRGYEDLKRKAKEAAWWIQPTFPVE